MCISSTVLKCIIKAAVGNIILTRLSFGKAVYEGLG